MVSGASQPSLDFPEQDYNLNGAPCSDISFTVEMTNSPDPDTASAQYPAITAVVDRGDLVEFYATAHIKIEASDGSTVWEGDVTGSLGSIHYKWEPKFPEGDYESGTWVVSGAVLPAGGTLYITITFHCQGEGEAIMKLFPLATEDHHSSPPASLSGITDKKNIWTNGTHWFPVHNSYDPWDATLESGHSWQEPDSWETDPTDKTYTKASIYITQFEAVPEFPVEPYIITSLGFIAYALIRSRKKI